MTSKTTNKFSLEVRAPAVRMVLDHAGEHASRWAAVSSIAAKIGCTAQTLHEWVKKAERDSGVRAGVPTDVATKLKSLERENRELRQANEILRKASAYFAQAELAISIHASLAVSAPAFARRFLRAGSTITVDDAWRGNPEAGVAGVLRRQGHKVYDP